MGMFDGLNMSWDSGGRKILVALDSQATLLLVKREITDYHPLTPLVSCYKALLNRDWEVKLEHTYHEGNRAADKLTNWGFERIEGYQRLAHPPVEVAQNLLEDVVGTTFLRLVKV